MESEIVEEVKALKEMYGRPANTTPFWPTVFPDEVKRTCSKCGITLERVMSYCCPHNNCPTGLGSAMCTM